LSFKLLHLLFGSLNLFLLLVDILFLLDLKNLAGLDFSLDLIDLVLEVWDLGGLDWVLDLEL